MAVRLHRCTGTFVKLSGHPCWKVQKGLTTRDEVERISGQRKYPEPRDPRGGTPGTA